MRHSRTLPKYYLAAALMTASVLAPVAAHAEKIHDIKVEGAQRIENATIMSYVNLSPGDEFDAAKLDAALKNLYATGLFADVSFYQEGQDLVISVAENPIINEIRFEGNDQIKKDSLLSEIQLRPRTVFTRTKVQADLERLQNLYRLSGRFSATIEPKIIKLDQNRVNLVFEVTEGPKTRISRIVFIGNKHFDDKELQTIVRSQEERWWRFLTDDDKYDPDRMDYDRELLRKYYLENGYIDFRVDGSTAELSPDRKSFYLTYALNEGDRYKVGTVSVVSNIDGFDAAKIKDVPLVKSGEWYKASLVEKTVSKITDAMATQQYAFVDVVPEINRNPDAKTVDLTFKVNPGRKVFVENVNISGNSRTLDEVVRRQMTLAEGDAFNLSKLKKSEQNLRNLSYFEKVQVKPVPGSTPEKTNIDISVSEKSTGELSIGGGYSTSDGPLADFRIRERNFLGKGQDLSFSTTLAQRRTEFDISFTEPYFLKRDLSAGFDLFNVTEDRQDQSSYDSKRTGAGLRLGYPLAENWRQTLGYRFQVNEIDNVDPGASLFIKQQQGTYSTSSVTQRLSYDTTDNKLMPTEGFVSRLDTELSGFGGDSRYAKAKLGGTYYYPVAEKWILSLLGEGGYAVGLGKDVRINERFTLGGDSLRGFASNGVGPRDKLTRDALGGNRFWRGSVQMDFPSGLPEDLGVRFQAFTDYGAMGQIDASGGGYFDNEAPRVSVGFGVSWQSPMGPLVANFAVPVMKEDFDETEFFRFNFGTRF